MKALSPHSATKPLRLLLFPALAVSGSLSSLADPIAWNNPASGIWSAGANWSTGVVPDADSLVTIGAEDVNLADYLVTLDTNTSISSLNISTLTGGLSMNGRGLTIANGFQAGTGAFSATNSTLSAGSLTNSLPFLFQASGGDALMGVTGAAGNTAEMRLRVEVPTTTARTLTANFDAGLTNSGTLALEGGGAGSGLRLLYLNVAGTLDNSGTLSSSGRVSSFINADLLVNTGTITSPDATGLSFSRPNGVINNSSAISAPGTSGLIVVTQSGGISNFATGSFAANRGVSLSGGGAFLNEGSITTSNGTITINGFTTGENTGTISSGLTSGSDAIRIVGGGTFTNRNSISCVNARDVTISKTSYEHKSGAVVAGGGGGTLFLEGDISMENGFAPTGFSSVSVSDSTVSGAGVLAVGANPTFSNVTFASGTALEFTGTALHVFDEIFNESLVFEDGFTLGSGRVFRIQSVNAQQGTTRFEGGLTNLGTLRLESTATGGGLVSNRVQVGGVFENQGLIDFRPQVGNNVTRILAASTLDNSGVVLNSNSVRAWLQIGTITNEEGGLLHAANGDLLVFSNTFLNSGELRADSGATLKLDNGNNVLTNTSTGRITGNGSFVTDGTVVDNGIISPGNSFGTLEVTSWGYVQNPGGVLEMEIGGSTPGVEHDQLVVSNVVGTTSLQGTLRLIFTDGFLPQMGEVFNLISGPVAANFQDVEVVGLGPGFQYQLNTTASGLAIEALNDATMAPVEIRITDASFEATIYTTLFESEPGLADWIVSGGTDLVSFPDDLTGDSTIIESAPGEYQAQVDLSAVSEEAYYLRLGL